MSESAEKPDPASPGSAPPVPAASAAAPAVPATTLSAPVIKPPLSYTQKVMIAVGITAATILLVALIYFTSEILVLIFAGLLFAVFLSAPADLLARHTRIPRSYALGLVLLVLTVTVLGGGYFMGYTITVQTQTLKRTLPGALTQFAVDIEHRLIPVKPIGEPATAPGPDATQAATGPMTATAPATLAATASAPATSQAAATSTAPAEQNSWIADKLSQVREATMDFFFSESFVKGAGGVTGKVVSSTFGVIGHIAVVLGVGLFFAINPRLYSQGLVKLIPISHRPRTAHILSEVGLQLQWWFVGQLCSMISISILTFIGLSILGIPMAFTLAILAGLMNFIPNFGPLIAAAPAVLIAFAPQGNQTTLNPSLAGWVIVMYIIIQLLEGWVITPFFQQRAVELPPALIIIAQVVFALLLGPIGLVLATPILAATIAIVRMVYVEDVLGDREKPAHGAPAKKG